MTLVDQVVNLKLSKKLSKLKFPQTSLFYWQQMEVKSNNFKLYYQPKDLNYRNYDDYSAHTATELGEMLPAVFAYTDPDGDGSYQMAYLSFTKDSISYRTANNKLIKSFTKDTEANCRAKMLIWLRENQHI